MKMYGQTKDLKTSAICVNWSLIQGVRYILFGYKRFFKLASFLKFKNMKYYKLCLEKLSRRNFYSPVTKTPQIL